MNADKRVCVCFSRRRCAGAHYRIFNSFYFFFLCVSLKVYYIKCAMSASIATLNCARSPMSLKTTYTILCTRIKHDAHFHPRARSMKIAPITGNARQTRCCMGLGIVKLIDVTKIFQNKKKNLLLAENNRYLIYLFKLYRSDWERAIKWNCITQDFSLSLAIVSHFIGLFFFFSTQRQFQYCQHVNCPRRSRSLH